MTHEDSRALQALRLYDAYIAVPQDRGGAAGPKGLALQAFLDAKKAALESGAVLPLSSPPAFDDETRRRLEEDAVWLDAIPDAHVRPVGANNRTIRDHATDVRSLVAAHQSAVKDARDLAEMRVWKALGKPVLGPGVDAVYTLVREQRILVEQLTADLARGTTWNGNIGKVCRELRHRYPGDHIPDNPDRPVKEWTDGQLALAILRERKSIRERLFKALKTDPRLRAAEWEVDHSAEVYRSTVSDVLDVACVQSERAEFAEWQLAEAMASLELDREHWARTKTAWANFLAQYDCKDASELEAKLANALAEVERLTPKPSPHEELTSAVYRAGPVTAEMYDEAIQDLENAKRALIEGDTMGCRVCEDSGHSACHCHHNPLVLARKWARATSIFPCFHCAFIATNDDEAREHFGLNEDEPPACKVAALRRALEELEAANDQVCATRPQAAYDAMIDGGQEDDLNRLDEARRAARTLLATLRPPVAGER